MYFCDNLFNVCFLHLFVYLKRAFLGCIPSAWPIMGVQNSTWSPGKRVSAWCHPACWGLTRARTLPCWLPALVLFWRLASPPSELLVARGTTLIPKYPLWVVEFWLLRPDSRAHWVVGGMWAGCSPSKSAGLGTFVQFIHCPHTQKPCTSQAPTLCVFYSKHPLVCPGWPLL